ncbi:hypothetical protein C453_01170 [Haloferax elongans ATCC BAA-1513]|uniref:Uncharacterized protein n=1 Tax=Haloferax elongans ATCC BAA-1513 TaxID=1230453 RepID=M0HWD3_HALEO|nr:hypothetical protein [Haloferax elongans]ELZ88831.1 hypothetical protein C453_01170 [Haloferax elongans ATCC BAA-1513]
MDKILQELDWKSQEVLLALYEQDGEGNTTEIRKLTGLESNDTILYRLRNVLEPADLIKTEQPPSETARPEPKIARLTERGWEATERLVDTRERTYDLGEKVEKLTADLRSVTETVRDLESAVEEDASGGDEQSVSHEIESSKLREITTRLDSLTEDVSAIEARVDHIENGRFGGWSDTKQQEFESLWDGYVVFKHFLENEVEPVVDGELADYQTDSE